MKKTISFLALVILAGLVMAQTATTIASLLRPSSTLPSTCVPYSVRSSSTGVQICNSSGNGWNVASPPSGLGTTSNPTFATVTTTGSGQIQGNLKTGYSGGSYYLEAGRVSGYTGIWTTGATPSLSNYAFLYANPDTLLNAPSGEAVRLRAGNVDTLVSSAAGTQLAGIAFASLGTPANGTITYCTNCTIANPCASGGTGAIAKRLNSVWVCN